MKFAKKVIVAVDMNDTLSQSLSKIKNLEFLADSEIHFIHVVQKMRYMGIMVDFPLVFPLEGDRNAIHESTLAILNNASKVCLPQGYKGKVVTQCLFDTNPKFAFTEYVKEQKADLIIIPTRKKHGFFESSFADYVNKHTEAELLLLKV